MNDPPIPVGSRVRKPDGSPNSRKSDQTSNEESLLQTHLEMNTGFTRCNVETHRVRLTLVYYCHSARGGGENAPDGLKADCRTEMTWEGSQSNQIQKLTLNQNGGSKLEHRGMN